MKVSVKIAPFSNKARIVVDGKVYAEQKLKLFSGSSFSAVVNGTEFGFEYLLHGTAGEYILYADGNIIANRYGLSRPQYIFSGEWFNYFYMCK